MIFVCFCERRLKFLQIADITHFDRNRRDRFYYRKSFSQKFCNSLHKPKTYTNYIILLLDNLTFLINNGCC